jgi:hypothetical protein
MNIYSDDLFSEALRLAYFPNEDVRSSWFQVGGKLWKIPAIRDRRRAENDGIRPIVRNSFVSQFIDFYEPINPRSDLTPTEVKKIDWIPQADHGLVSSTEWFDRQLNRSYEPAPTILWENFQNWDDFISYVQTNRSNLFADSRRRRRKIENKLGSLTFVFDDSRAEIMETCMQWKSAQYLKSEVPDLFFHPQHVRLFQELAKNKLLLVSSMSAGERLLAVHLGMLATDRVYWWIPAYDPAYSEYSPGRLMMESLMEESFHRHHREFDLMIGGESYKWHYATHTRKIRDVGLRPPTVQIHHSLNSFKQSQKEFIARYPQIEAPLKQIHQTLKKWPLVITQPSAKKSAV